MVNQLTDVGKGRESVLRGEGQSTVLYRCVTMEDVLYSEQGTLQSLIVPLQKPVTPLQCEVQIHRNLYFSLML